MLENVKLVEDKDGVQIPDYFDVSKTQNGRVSYPIFHIDDYVSSLYTIVMFGMGNRTIVQSDPIEYFCSLA